MRSSTSRGSPSSISGARNMGVPTGTTGSSSRRDRSSAMPQSTRYTSPKRPTSTLAGFTSRWMMPRACAKASVLATCERISRCASRRSAGKVASSAHAGCSGWSSRSCQLVPSTRFMTRTGRPSSVAPSACTGTMPGCSSAPLRRASRSSDPLASGRSSRTSFTATLRSSEACRASYTSPMPPSPSSSPSSRSQLADPLAPAGSRPILGSEPTQASKPPPARVGPVAWFAAATVGRSAIVDGRTVWSRAPAETVSSQAASASSGGELIDRPRIARRRQPSATLGASTLSVGGAPSSVHSGGPVK